MKTVKDRAIILRRKSFGEADWLLTLLTQNHGKIKAIAKGARKVTSRLAGFSELFTVVSCQINFQPSIPIISQVTHELLLDGVTHNLAIYQSLHIFAEVVDSATHEDDVQPALYAFVRDGFSRLVVDNRVTTLTEVLLGLTRQLGIVPQVEVCSLCGEAIKEGQAVVWDVEHGGLVHTRSTRLRADEVKLLRALVADRLPQGVAVGEVVAKSVQIGLVRHIEYSLDKSLIAARQIQV